MASSKTAPVAQNDTSKSEGLSSEAGKGHNDPSIRSAVIGSLTLAEHKDIISAMGFAAVAVYALTLAHWSDIIAMADALAAKVKDVGIGGEKTVSATARKIGTLCPMETARFRLAIVSYQLSGRRCNPTQGAELAAKLPMLRKVGALKQGEVTFGAIVIPPSLGDF